MTPLTREKLEAQRRYEEQWKGTPQWQHRDPLQDPIFDKPTTETLKTYTKEEVCEILCEGCKRHLNTHYSPQGKTEHYVNGFDVPCLASEFRKKITAHEAWLEREEQAKQDDSAC